MVSIGFLIVTIYLMFTYQSFMQIKLMQKLIVSLGVLSLSLILSTTSELLPVVRRKTAVVLRIASLITMLIAFGLGLAGLYS